MDRVADRLPGVLRVGRVGAGRGDRHLERSRRRREPLRRSGRGTPRLLQRAARRRRSAQRPAREGLPAGRLRREPGAQVPGPLPPPRTGRRLRLLAEPPERRPAEHRPRLRRRHRDARGGSRLLRELVERREAQRPRVGGLPPRAAHPVRDEAAADQAGTPLARDRRALDGRRGRDVLRLSTPRVLRLGGGLLGTALDPAPDLPGGVRLRHGPEQGGDLRRPRGAGVLLARAQPEGARREPDLHAALRRGRRRRAESGSPERGAEHLRPGRRGGARPARGGVRDRRGRCRDRRHLSPASGHPRLAVLA